MHPTKKDLMVSTNENAIKRAVKNLILTQHYESPFHSELGSNVYTILFEPLSAVMGYFIENEIYNLLNNFEPRIKLSGIDVFVDYDNGGYQLKITYYIVGQTNPVSVSMFLEKTR